MKSRIIASIVGLLTIIGLAFTSAGSASAASRGVLSYTMNLSCTSGGSTFSLNQKFDIDPGPPGTTGFIYLRGHSWSTSPAAQFDRIAIAFDTGPDPAEYDLMYAMGSSSSTQNDVPSSGSSSTDNGLGSSYYQPGAPRLRMSAYGGTGNSTDSCAQSKPIPV